MDAPHAPLDPSPDQPSNEPPSNEPPSNKPEPIVSTHPMRPWSPLAMVVGWDLLDDTTICFDCFVSPDDWGVGKHPTAVRWHQAQPAEKCDRCNRVLVVIASMRIAGRANQPQAS